jgi:hypothetical protein
MANDLHTSAVTEAHAPPEPHLASLVTGIVSDVQDLVKQQVAMLRQEIRNDFQKTKEAAIPLLVGLICCFLGGIVLCFAVAHLLEWACRPNLPLWACYAIVGGVIAICGGILAYVGMKKLPNPLPDRTVAALQENVQWMTKRK